MTEAARLQKIRTLHAAIAPGRWNLASDGDGMLIEAQGTQGELVPILRADGKATTEELEFAAAAPEFVAFLLKLVDRAIAAARKQKAQPPPKASQPKDYAAEAAMKCQEPAFKAFLEARHGLERPLTDERVAQRLRSLLGVTSRAVLNHDAAAAKRWKNVRREFEAWRKAG